MWVPTQYYAVTQRPKCFDGMLKFKYRSNPMPIIMTFRECTQFLFGSCHFHSTHYDDGWWSGLRAIVSFGRIIWSKTWIKFFLHKFDARNKLIMPFQKRIPPREIDLCLLGDWSFFLGFSSLDEVWKNCQTEKFMTKGSLNRANDAIFFFIRKASKMWFENILGT